VREQAPGTRAVDQQAEPGARWFETVNEGLMQLSVEAPQRKLAEADRVAYELLHAGEPAKPAPRVGVGQALFVRVESRVCLDGSCDREPSATCSVRREGRELRVSSVLRRKHVEAADHACTEDCVLVAATCKTAALEAGEYVVWFDQQKLTLQVPGPLDETILASRAAR